MIRPLTCIALLTAAVPAAAQTGRESSAPSVSEVVSSGVSGCDVTMAGDDALITARLFVRFQPDQRGVPVGDLNGDRMQSMSFTKIQFNYSSSADGIVPTVNGHAINTKGTGGIRMANTACGGPGGGPRAGTARVIPSPRAKPEPMLEAPARSAGSGIPMLSVQLQRCSVGGSPAAPQFDVTFLVPRGSGDGSVELSILPGGSGDPSAVSCDGKGGGTTGYDVALNKKV